MLGGGILRGIQDIAKKYPLTLDESRVILGAARIVSSAAELGYDVEFTEKDIEYCKVQQQVQDGCCGVGTRKEGG